jgi:hypothetical protein
VNEPFAVVAFVTGSIHGSLANHRKPIRDLLCRLIDLLPDNSIPRSRSKKGKGGERGMAVSHMGLAPKIDTNFR